MTLRDHVAIVTGGSQGIGQAIAERLEGDGAQVAVLDLAASPSVDVTDETAGSRSMR